ncbi:MAG: hypothetical protein ABI823_11795 [Bryobacteraceae bacterium]
MNAVTHGLTAAKPYLPTERPSYEAFAADQLQRLAPQTQVEHELSQTIIDATWRLRRIPALEARLFEDDSSGNATDPHKIVRSLDTLSRHELRLRKLLTAATAELQDRLAIRRNMQKQQGLPSTPKQSGFVLQTPAHVALNNEPPHSIHTANAPSTPEIGMAGSQSSSQAA